MPLCQFRIPIKSQVSDITNVKRLQISGYYKNVSTLYTF